MILAHKIALDPNDAQETYFRKAAGTARFAYNWALTEWQRQYDAWKADPTGSKPSDPALRKQLNAMKREQFPWMLEVTKNAPQMAIIHLGQAFKNFWNGHADYPTFKKKGRHDRFTLSNDQFAIQGHKVRMPHIGWVRLREPLRFLGRVIEGTVSRTADRWFLSVTVEIPDPPRIRRENQAVVGVDLGVSALATLSTGEKVVGPKAYAAAQAKLRRLQQHFSRQMEVAKARAGLQPGQPIPKGMHIPWSKNMVKTQRRLARLHAQIVNIRADVLHKLTTDLVARFDVMAIEDLHVAGMLKNHKLARAIADMGFGEFRRQLEYKAAQRGKTVVVVSRWYPSSKICSACGYRMAQMPLSVREWTCPACGMHHDRDINAAINLQTVAESSMGGCPSVLA
ncbi:RNA-guided endonuclease InsQ/TnpB family protein [Sulfobacillus thermosulfidooxidans]|uniref:RNA-guided endonuclease InsQ/TnpB family protein n=1 Tax=Sulfobacillus thermosulfidooxidans TaxID=28034 RepID=UPI000ACA3932|nr:RNA-guided endonuclease TnpB family protein [Sulfobacillus thermosulfidooxidans]